MHPCNKIKYNSFMEYFNTGLLQIYQWVCQQKNFENRLTFGEVMGKSLVSCFFWLMV